MNYNYYVSIKFSLRGMFIMNNKITVDGCYAAANIAYAFSDLAAIYPITPSSPMAENCDTWAHQKRKNIYGEILKIAEMQSEAGAAGAVHGSLTAGALATTFTASQGLLLMIPNMYKIAGELLPTVFHVSARTVATHALSIFGDHSDVMAVRQTGFGMLCSNSVQEAMDMALIAHLSALKSSIPFVHFFDGFRTSHEVSKIEDINYDDIKKLADELEINKDILKFRNRGLRPENPSQKGTAQNPDTFFQNREAANKYYLELPFIVEKMMIAQEKITKRKYNLFDYYGPKDAEKVIVAMGSGCEAIEETIDYLNSKNIKLGLIKVRLYRPFSINKFVEKLPKTCKYLTVLDRTKESGSIGEPLYLDVLAALQENKINNIQIFGGRYGLSSKEFNPTMVYAIYKNMNENGKNHFTVGINDDVTNISLDLSEKIDASPKNCIRCKFYGFGSDGTVGANKNTIKIIGNYTEKYAQGYFAYDSKKSGGFTVSHLRFGDSPIKSSYLIDTADFVACHNPSYVTRYNLTGNLKENGIFLLNCPWDSISELEKKLPYTLKRDIAKKNIKFYVIDALKIAKECSLGNKVSTVLQSAFFNLTDVMKKEEANKRMKEYAYKTFIKKGEKIVENNCLAIDKASENLIEINYPKSWENTTDGAEIKVSTTDSYFVNFISPILSQEGDNLPVSMFMPDGSVPTDTIKYEKRGVGSEIPDWEMEKCIQCNQCSYVCPHAAIRPVLQTQDKLTNSPENFITKDAAGFKGYKFRIQVSPLDCVGCTSCVNVCPANALHMKPFEYMEKTQKENWEFFEKLPLTDAKFRKDTVKGSQFAKPYFEFSGACPGCGETPYIKLITQLFGNRMIISNATGCSSIYGGSSPTCPYAKDNEGKGPAWGNSLFEDNAEYGFGMYLAHKQRREYIKSKIELSLKKITNSEIKNLFESWLNTFNQSEENYAIAENIRDSIENLYKNEKDLELKEIFKNIFESKDSLIKKSLWIIGGDGWAYDIGYGGLDHVLAQGEDINILVLDTEVYSNTGGQASKSSPIGAIAKFAANGKRSSKKDLGRMAMSYENVYVAQCAMGASQSQFVNAAKEAESYNGPSIIIAYSPCIEHGIMGGMGKSQEEEKRAVEAGYWYLYRYNPALEKINKNPFKLDSRKPNYDIYKEYLLNENRYSRLAKEDPEAAEILFELNKKASQKKYNYYLALSKMDLNDNLENK